MKRFKPLQELQFRGFCPPSPVKSSPLLQGFSLTNMFMFALCVSVFAGGLFGTVDVFAAAAEVTTAIGTFKVDVIGVLTAALGAFIAIGSAAVFIFAAISILKWFRAAI